MPSELIAKVFRGETVESQHFGHLAIVENGAVVASIGDPNTVTYFRSAAKAFQAIPFVTSGAADAFGFSEREFALAVASHSGEPEHVALAAAMLEKAGLAESDLRCGPHLPFDSNSANALISAGREPTQLHNNCSGKHAAMLAFAKHIGATTEDYDAVDHRIQKRILRCVSEFTGVAENEIAIGIDGCSAPNFALPVVAMARSFAKLVSPVGLHELTRMACERIVKAMIAHPDLVGGRDRLDTRIMLAANGKVISKVGADGVWLCGILPCDRWPNGLGIALKVEDGDDFKARPAVSIDILRQLGMLGNEDLTDISPLPVKSRRGAVVGMIRSTLVIKL
ncbi:MAG TPA: asparaginase [Pyrinomonadaceae bacterium]|nr:asparaginase [Pyrinomonadaceae bacterium]